MTDSRPLVLHVVYRFDTGGLENGVVNLVNRMPQWRHAVLALTDVAPAFAARIVVPGVELIALHKPPGGGWKVLPAFVRALHRLQPQVVHTRNLAALEMQPGAWWAGVPVRIHGEHGRDASDPDGSVRRYRWERRFYSPFVHHYVALSRDLEAYLRVPVGIQSARINQIYNGVDSSRFSPAPAREAIAGCPFGADPALCVVGTVGRMLTVKAQPLLAQAFVDALRAKPDLRSTLRLVLVGNGPLRDECQEILAAAGVANLAWLPGERTDIPAIMRGLDVFVLPSLAEGISNTVLEAMASGLPVIATAVGGNADLVEDGRSGQIVAPGDVPALARAIADWAVAAERRRSAGAAGRRIVEQRFSLAAMVDAYRGLYDRQLSARRSADRH